MYMYVCVGGCVSAYIYKNLYYFITLIVVNISFLHRLMSFKVQLFVSFNGTSRKEDRTQQEKK